MTVHRLHKKKNLFSMILNEGAEEKSLSFGARGLLWYLLTKPDGWVVRNTHLASVSTQEGEKRVNTLLRELEVAGYVFRWAEHGDRGRIEWHSEIFECVEDSHAWQKENEATISKAFRSSKGALTIPPTGMDGQRMDGQRGHIVNTESSNTDSYSFKENMVENSQNEENEDDSPNEPASQNHPKPDTRVEALKDDRPAAATGSLGTVAKRERAQYEPDAFEIFWKGYFSSVKKCKAAVSAGTKVKAKQAWDKCFKDSHDRPTLAQQIIKGAEEYWRIESLKSPPWGRNANTFLDQNVWTLHLEVEALTPIATSAIETAHDFSVFLTCWNETRPMSWPEENEALLDPAVMGALRAFASRYENSLERFQMALMYAKRDEYLSLRRIYTFGEFLRNAKIDEFYKKQKHQIEIGVADRVGDLVEIAKATDKDRRDQNLLLERQYERQRRDSGSTANERDGRFLQGNAW